MSNYIGPQVSLFKRNPADLEEKSSKKKIPSTRCTLPRQGTIDASAVEGKKPRKVNFEKWQHSDSSSLTAASGAILQWREDIPSYSWDSDGDWKTN